GQGGFLCPLDDVNAFAQAVHRLGADPNLRARMGAFNRARAEAEFSLQVCVQNYLSLYRELL
ncbi:MAG TPA: glycosyltransferase family 1 protein, partial [Dehalococcoidia bacterium]|nr:glycosyltransferase family 1 protein [Dehalococcoidia bacterium]